MGIEDNRERLNRLTDSVCSSRMYDEANAYKFSVETAPEICGPKRNAHDAYHDFLAGWRAAMEVTHAELLEENNELHGMLMDICAKLMIRRCDKCKGMTVDDNLDPCDACDSNGYINLPGAEQVIEEITKRNGIE